MLHRGVRKGHGRPQTFSRGGQNFQGRAKTYYLLKKQQNNMLFISKKVKKHTICRKSTKKKLFFSKKVKKHTIYLKRTKKDVIFLEKKSKTYFFTRPRGGGAGARAHSSPPLRTPIERCPKNVTHNLNGSFFYNHSESRFLLSDAYCDHISKATLVS